MYTLQNVLKKKRPDLFNRFVQLSGGLSDSILRNLGKNDSVHSRNIIEILNKLIPQQVLINPEILAPEGIYLLLVATFLHDIGRIDPNGHHEVNSYNIIIDKASSLYLNEQYVAEAVAEICAAHASEKVCPIDNVKTNYGIEGFCQRSLNLAHLGALLRISDELDNSFLRVNGITTEQNSPRQLIRYIDPQPDRRLIEIQGNPHSESEYNRLLKICEYTQQRLHEVKHKLYEMKIFYDHIKLDPPKFTPVIRSILQPITNKINSVDINRPIEVKLEYKKEKIDANTIRSIAFSPCGNYMAYSRDERIEVVMLTPQKIGPFAESFGDHSSQNIEQDAKVFTNRNYSMVTDLCFSPDGNLVASSAHDGTINVWNFHTKQNIAILDTHIDSVTAISFSPKGDFFASGGYDEKVHIWDVNNILSGEKNPFKTFNKKSMIKKKPKHPHDLEEIQSIVFSNDGKHIATGDQQGVVVVREIKTGREMYRSKIHNQHIVALRFSPIDSSLLITASDDTRIRLVDCNRDGISTLGVKNDKHMKAITSIAISNEGNILVSADAEGFIKIWNINDRKLLYTYQGSSDGYMTNRLAFSPNRYSFASNSFMHSINLWSITNKGDIQNAIITEK